MNSQYYFHRSDEDASIFASVADDRPDISWLNIKERDVTVTYFFKNHDETRRLIDSLSKTLPTLEYGPVTEKDRDEAAREDNWDRIREERDMEKPVRAEAVEQE